MPKPIHNLNQSPLRWLMQWNYKVIVWREWMRHDVDSSKTRGWVAAFLWFQLRSLLPPGHVLGSSAVPGKMPGKCMEFARNPDTITLYNFTINLPVTSKVEQVITIIHMFLLLFQKSTSTINKVIGPIFTMFSKTHQAIAVWVLIWNSTKQG